MYGRTYVCMYVHTLYCNFVIMTIDMNAESSRSHSIFILKVSQKNTTNGTLKVHNNNN